MSLVAEHLQARPTANPPGPNRASVSTCLRICQTSTAHLSESYCASVSYCLRISQATPHLLERHVKPQIDAALSDTPVVVIVGPRQSGKSTLAELVALERDAHQLTLDDAGRRAAAVADPTGFVERLQPPVVIDEFQKAPELLPAIKVRVDRARAGGRRAAGMFLLTGSANVWGTLQVSESLAGRAERVQLWPLSQGEMRGRRETFLDELLAGRVPAVTGAPSGRSSIATALVTGGYPEMLARHDARRRSRWIANYIQMILERDARDVAGHARHLDELPRLLAAAAARVANLLDLAGLGRDVKLSRDTTARYLTVLELLFLVRRTPAWSKNIGQRLIKAPKLWLPDSGLAAQLVGREERHFEDDDTPLAGALFENFIACEIAKQATWSETDIALHHFRSAGGIEIDLVVEARDGSLAAIESKLSSTVRERDFNGLRHLRERLGRRFRAGVVVHTGPETLPFGDRLWAIPTSALWT
jgi:predicted AAA+ superfamily ATPase